MGRKPTREATQDAEMGKRITRARERLGVTITDLGYAYNGSANGRARVQHWEKGGNFPQAAELPKLCRMLLMDGNYLLGFSELPHATNKEIAVAREELLSKADIARLAEKGAALAHDAPKKRRTPLR